MACNLYRDLAGMLLGDCLMGMESLLARYPSQRAAQCAVIDEAATEHPYCP